MTKDIDKVTELGPRFREFFDSLSPIEVEGISDRDCYKIVVKNLCSFLESRGCFLAALDIEKYRRGNYD